MRCCATSVAKERARHWKTFSSTMPCEHRDWFAHHFNTLTNEMDSAEVHERNADGTSRLDVWAKRAIWQNGYWRFYEVEIQNYTNRYATSHIHVAETNFPAFKDPPRRMILEWKAADQMTSSELRQQIRTLKLAGPNAHRLPELEFELQDRFAFPFICLIVVWLAIPLGMRVSRSGPLLAVGEALGLVVAFYILHQFLRGAGKGGHLAPVVAAWLNNVIFITIGAILAWWAR